MHGEVVTVDCSPASLVLGTAANTKSLFLLLSVRSSGQVEQGRRDDDGLAEHDGDLHLLSAPRRVRELHQGPPVLRRARKLAPNYLSFPSDAA